MWVVDPDDRSVTVFRPRENQRLVEEAGELTGNGILADLRLRAAELFVLPGSTENASP